MKRRVTGPSKLSKSNRSAVRVHLKEARDDSVPVIANLFNRFNGYKFRLFIMVYGFLVSVKFVYGFVSFEWILCSCF